MIESDNPPTKTQLAELGTRHVGIPKPRPQRSLLDDLEDRLVTLIEHGVSADAILRVLATALDRADSE